MKTHPLGGEVEPHKHVTTKWEEERKEKEREREKENNPLVTRTTPQPLFLPHLFWHHYEIQLLIPYWFTIHDAFIPNKVFVFHGVPLFIVDEPNDFSQINGPRHNALQGMSNRSSSAKSLHDVFPWGGHASNGNAFHDNANAIDLNIIWVAHCQALLTSMLSQNLLHWFWRVGGGERGIKLRWVVGVISTSQLFTSTTLCQMDQMKLASLPQQLDSHNDHLKL